MEDLTRIRIFSSLYLHLERAKKNFEEENRTNDKPYQLSASMGCGVSNLGVETMDDFMNRIDKQMYQDKLAYYEKNDRRK